MTTDANLAIIYLIGAIFLLLYGMRVSGEALQRVVGHRLRRLLFGLGRNPLAAFGIGAAVTALMQSSSATTIMLVGFARAGLLEMRQALGIILGADVGTTLTVQLLAFKVYDYALLLVAIGGGLFLASRRQGTRDVGDLGEFLAGVVICCSGARCEHHRRTCRDGEHAEADSTDLLHVQPPPASWTTVETEDCEKMLGSTVADAASSIT